MAIDQNPNISQDQQNRLELPDENVVNLVMKMIKPGEDDFRNRRRRYDQSYDIWRASEKRPRSLEPWQSKLRVPYAMQVIDTALVNMATGKPRIMVKPRRPEEVIQAKAMQVILDYFVDEDHLVEKQPLFAQQGLIYGVTAAKVHWIYKTRNRTRRVWDELGQKIIADSDVVRDGPTFEPWSIYDCWWDPSARDVDSARYFVLRSYLSKEQLLADQCTAPVGHSPEECNGIYHNVDELLKAGTTDIPQTTAQQRFLSGAGGSGDSRSIRYKDLFEILEIWTDDTVTTIGARKILLRHNPNPYWHGRKPIVLAQTRPDLFEMQGVPETELVDHLQQSMWTLQNMTIDNLNLTTMRGVTYREGGVTDPNALQLKPRFKWPVVDHDDIRPFEIPPISSDVYQERSRLLSDMQLVTGINPYISGSDLSSVDQNTATGVTALQEVASRLLRFKAAQLQYKGYQRTFEMWGEMTQQFLDKNVAVSIAGPHGEDIWIDVSPADVAGNFHYSIEGSEESLSRQQERGEAIALLNALAPLAQTGTVNLKPVLERVALAYNFSNVESLFNNTPAQQQQQQQQQQPSSAPQGNPDPAQLMQMLTANQQQSQGTPSPAGGVAMSPALLGQLGRLGG